MEGESYMSFQKDINLLKQLYEKGQYLELIPVLDHDEFLVTIF